MFEYGFADYNAAYSDALENSANNRPGVSESAIEEKSSGAYCPVCDVSGANKAANFAACFDQANYAQCGDDEYCGVEVRQRKSEVTSLRVGCMKVSKRL